MEGTGYKQLKRSKTLEEVLQTAMIFERTAQDFYRDLCDRVSKPLRSLARELADEEQRHYDLFRDLLKREDVREVVKQHIKMPANDHRFSDYIQLPDLGESPDDQAVLQYALGREQAAMEQYTALAAESPPGPIHDLFAFLAKEELAHKSELEKRYYELVYPSNV
jgi:rubrerythrin